MDGYTLNAARTIREYESSSYICKMKAEINPKLSDCEREHNSLNRTMHIKVADSRRNRLAQDRDKPRNITPRYDDDSHDSQ